MTETHYYTCDICTEQFSDDRMLLGFIIAPPVDDKTGVGLSPPTTAITSTCTCA